MWTLVVALMSSGCSDPTPAPAEPAPAARTKAKTKAGAKAKRPAPAPLGVAGPVTGELKLTVLESGDAPAAPAPGEGEAPPGEAAPAPAPAPPASAPVTVKHTQADLVLTFSDGQTLPVTLGKVTGTCAEVPIQPIGPADKPQTPLWSVQCTDAVTTSDLAVLQVGDQILVLRAMPTPAGGLEHKPVKRFKLAPGATLSRKAG